MRRCTLIVALMAAVYSSASAQEAESPLTRLQAAPLVYIDDTVITVLQFGDYLHAAGVIPSGRVERDLDTLEASLETLIDKTIIVLESDSSAILADPGSARRARWRQAQVAGPLVFRELVAPRVSVTADEIEQFHRDSLRSLFTAPPRRKLRQILITPQKERVGDKLIKTRASVEQARERAESLLVQIRAGAAFDSLAGLYSDDSSSRVEGGDLGWVFPGNTIHAFDTAAFSGLVGDVRGPVKSMYGYHLIQIEAERPESTIALDETVAAQIRMQLEFVRGRQLGTAWADSAIAATQWTYNDSALNRMPDVAADTWVVRINDRDTLRYGDWEGAWEFYKRSQNIRDAGTLEQKHGSLRKSGFSFLYIQAAEDHGFADDPAIRGERIQHIQSEAIRMAHTRLRELQEPPELPPLTEGVETEMSEKPLRLQMIRAQDTATIWSAYKRLVAGNRMSTVARWYHDNLREVRAGDWDLGWVGKDDLPAPLWGAAWILSVGNYTRPIEYESSYYILRLADRKEATSSAEDMVRRRNQIVKKSREQGLKKWRDELRAGHVVRLNRSTWQRVRQLWRP